MNKEQITKIRKKSGLNQQQFAARLGVSPAQVSRLESGNRDAKPQTIILLKLIERGVEW